jgi:hypothetical protein
VMLRHPATDVRVTIGDRTVRLPRQGRMPYYSGFLQPAGLIDGALRVIPDGGRMHWTGVHPRWVTVTIRAKGFAPLQRRVELSPGWG